MTPVMQRTTSDCSRAALASLLDLAYEQAPALDGFKENEYYDNLHAFLEQRGLFMLEIPMEEFHKCLFYLGECFTLATVESKRHPGRGHHVVAKVKVYNEGKGDAWEVSIAHDPFKHQGPYTLRSIEFVVPRRNFLSS